MLQLENHTFSRSQFFQRTRNPAAKLTPHEVAFGICPAAPIRHLRQHVILLTFRIYYYGRVLFPYLLLANIVQAQICNNPVNPGVERTLETETSDIFVCLQESFLIDVLSFVL